MKISKFNREINHRLPPLHIIFSQFNRLGLLKKTVIDHDWPLRLPHVYPDWLSSFRSETDSKSWWFSSHGCTTFWMINAYLIN